MIRGSELIGQRLLNSNGHLTKYEVRKNIYLHGKLELAVFKLCNIESKKNIKEEERYIFYKRIKRITYQGLEIYSEGDIIHDFQMPALESALKKEVQVIGFEIYNESEDLMGIIKDTIIDETTGKVEGLLVSEGFFDDLINGFAILPLNERIKLKNHNIIFNNHDIRLMTHHNGGLKKLLGIDRPN